MANDPKTDPSKTQEPQRVPLAKIHPLPGRTVATAPDRTYGGLVSSIQATGVKQAVILRQREDGEYQMVHGYRRQRASELAKQKDIPALVYDMTEKEALDYATRVQIQADLPIPGKLIVPAVKEEKTPAKEGQNPGEAATPGKEEKAKEGQKSEGAAAPGKEEKAKEGQKPEGAAFPGKEMKPQKPAPTTPDAPKGAEKPKEETPAVQDDTPPDKGEEKPEADQAPSKEADTSEKKGKAAPATAPTGPAAAGPTGTAITKIFEPRLDPPDEKALKDLPIPGEGESYFILLHPGYLEKSEYNTFSVDRDSDDFKELHKSIELTGVKEPALVRPKKGGGAEILSGQRRHLVAKELNYPVPVIIQRIDDDDAKILVADSNIHREKVTSYDLSRALRMKMDGMKRKAGRRRKDDPSVPALNSDEILAKEMGMSVSKLNKVLRLSEATQEVCKQYDEGSMELSIAYALSFLKPKNQDTIVGLSEIGYKLTTKRVERMKEPDKKGKLTDKLMRDILEDKDIAPQQQAPAPDVAGPATPADPPTGDGVPLPPSPDVPAGPAVGTVQPGQSAGSSAPQEKEEEDDITKGKQERPEHTKIVLAGDRLRYYFPDVRMTPREIEESIYAALEERRQRQERMRAKEGMKKGGPVR